MLYDDDFVLIDAGFQSISAAALEDGSGTAHEQLSMETIVNKEGYMYIYLSNEHDKLVDVFFDDLTIVHKKSPIVQTEDYYPFGLTFNQQTREGTHPQNYLYNGKELQTDLDLNWTDYGARMYDASIGRWYVVDPLADLYYTESPYQYTLNNPIKYIDPDGLGSINITELFDNAPDGISSYDGNGDCKCGCEGKPPCEEDKALVDAPRIVIAAKVAEEVIKKGGLVFAKLLGTIGAIMTPFSTGKNDVFFVKLSEEKENRYYYLQNKKNHGGGLTTSEEQEIWELEDEMYPHGNPFADKQQIGFKKMPQGNNKKKNEQVHSLYQEYGITDPADKRKIHDLITGKGLSREEIRKVIEENLSDR